MYQQLKKVTLLTVFVLLIALAITNQTGFHAESNTTKNFTIEPAETQVSISNTENGSIRAEKLMEKPIAVKNPPFEPLQYLHIHADNLTSSSFTIRIFNEWGRSDLIIYHYTGDDWQPLKTRINGSYLEAVTESFSVFAVGAQGGINIYLLASNLTFLNNTAAIAGAAYYNNSTAAAGIDIEINPSWGSFANTTTDARGNFLRMLTGPSLPGNYTVWVNATSGSLNGTNSSTVQATNATLYRINASASIANTTTANPYANISFMFPADAVPYSSNISLSLGSTTSMEVKVNNITIYNETTSSANLNLTGYLTRQNDINITTGGAVTLAYNINLSFHITKTAAVVKPSYYSASLAVANSMSYNWNNSNVTYHLPEGAYGVTVWENSTNLTLNSTIPARGGLLRIENNGTGTIYNNSLRLFSVNYSLAQVNLSITTDRQEAEKGENVYITPYVYFNDSQIDANAWIRIYRDSALVYNTNVSSGSPFAFSTSTAGVYNITATASPNIDGVVRSGANYTNLHIKDLLIYLIVYPTHSGKPINVTGRTYYTNCTACAGTVNLSMDGAYWNTTSNTTGYFNYSLPGKTAGSYVISANITTGNYTASTNATVNVLDNYFYVIKGNLPVSSGEKTLSPNATVWINQTNITRATLNIWGKTTENLTYNPYPPIDFEPIPTGLGSYLSGTFTIPVYPYDYIVIPYASLNTSAEPVGDPNKDMAFNLTIDGREINSATISAGNYNYTQLDLLTGYIPSILNPGNVQTVRVYNKNTNPLNLQQYYFTEDIYVSYVGHVGVPYDLYFKVNNNFTFAKMGDIPNATVDITGFSAASNSLFISNDRTSVVGYNYSLQKRYFGYTTHTVSKQTSRYNVNDTVVFTPEANLTSATVLIPLMDKAKDVRVFVNTTNVTDSATIGINMELPLSEINSTKLINVTYWAPVLDITPSVNNTQLNRGDTLQISANITYLGGNVSDATAYANITKAGTPVGNVTLNYTYGGTYIANYTLSSGAALGVYNLTVRAYNATTAINNESTTFKVRGLNVSANAGGPYVVGTNAYITGYVKDLENNSNINGASVNITIWNSTFTNTTTRTTNSTGYYNLSRLVDNAGDYNVTANASDANILGSANTIYSVRYNVSVAVSKASYNKNSEVPINVTVYDRALTPVSGATVNSTVNISGVYTYYNGTTDGNGMYNFTHSSTSTYGIYNITANVSKVGVLGNATGSFRVSNLTVTVYTQAEYQAGSTVVINGMVRDDDTGVYPSGALVNVTINNGSADIRQNTTTSSGNYTVSFLYVYAGVYTGNVDVTYTTLTGGNTTSFHMHYNANTSISKTLYAISETVPVNVTVLDVNNTHANANVSINITKPDAGVENLNGTTVNGYFNTSFSNASLEGDYLISVRALNTSTSAHGDAVNRSFRVTGFVVNASPDRSPGLYKPGEAVNISGVLRDTLGSPRVADVVIMINSSAGSEVANTTLYSRNGSYAWNTTNTSVAGWYTVSVNAATPEGAVNSTTVEFEVELNLPVTAQPQYNPGDAVNVTVLVRNGTAPESAVVNMAVQKFDIWDRFTGTYFDTAKMNATAPDCCTEALNYTQNDELLFCTTNVTQNDTWLGKAVQLNTTSLPSRFILDYEVSTNGSSAYLLSRPHIGNSTNYIRLNFRNYSDDAQDGYDFVINGATQSVKRESTNNMKVRLSIEYDSGTVRFYKNGEQMFQSNFILPSNSFIKLNGYARNPSTGTSAYIKYDNVTLYNLSSPVLNQSTAGGSGGNYTFNFTAGGIGMYRVNATTGNSSAYTTFLVRTLNVTTVVYGPYNFNESTLSSSTVVPLMVHGTVQDIETHANVTGAEVNISIMQSGIPYAYNVTSSNAGNYVLSFTQSFNSTAVGLFNVSASVNDSSILATQNNSFTAYTINQSWADQYKDYRVPILLYNDGSLVANWQFNEGVGTSVADSSGNGNTGTLYGASVSNPGFETVNSQWGSGAENLVFDNTRSKTGTYSGKIVKLTAGELTQFSSNNADNNAGTTLPSSSTQYKYGGCIYIEGGASADIFFFSWNSAGGTRYDGTYDAISTSAQNQWVCINGTTTNVVPADNLFAIRVDNNGGGTVWFDDIWVNAVEPWTGGKSGYGMRFDGVDDYVNVDRNVVNTTQAFSVSAWVKPGEYKTTAWEIRIVADRDTLNAFTLYQYNNSLGFGVWNNTENFSRITAENSLLIGEWTQAAATYNGNTIRLYVNGTLVNSTSVQGIVRDNLGALKIGGGEITGGVRAFNGTIDEVKIYNRALSDSEIANIYNSSNIAQSYNPSTVTFNLALPGGFSASSAKLYDIQGTNQNATILDWGSYVNVIFVKALGAYEGKILYLYFDRPNPTSPNSSAMSSLSAPYSVTNGTIEGYAITVTPDKPAYSAGENAVLSLQLQNVTGNYIVSDVNTTVYYPNGTIAQVNYTQTNATGQALVNYTIPSVKGSYTAITNATVNGISRKESTSFSTGDLAVYISKDKAVYNTLENASISVNVTENGNVTGAGVTLKIYNPNSINVLEQTKNTTALWTQTSDADFNSGTLWNVTVGSGNVTLAPDGGNYTLSGSLTSSVYDGVRGIKWGAMRWNATTPASTGITLYTRTSQDNSSWSDWLQGVNGGIIPNSSRYIQYRANLTTTDNTTTPTLSDVTIELAAPVNFTYTLSSSPLGNYTVTASASKSDNAGYNTTAFELDQFDISTAADRTVYTSSGSITVSGSTTYSGGSANASVNLTVKKNFAFNPSFETDLDNNGFPDGWVPAWQGVMTWDTTYRTGSKSVKVWRSSTNTSEGLWYYPYMYAISPDTYYTLSMWVKTDNNTGGNVRLWAYWQNGTTYVSNAINTILSIRAQDGWVLLQGSATSPSNATNVRVHLVSNIVGSVWFDDVNIEPENNPAIYMANTTSETSYSFPFSLSNSSSYIVYANGSYAANGILNRSNTTIFTVRSLDVNASAGGPYEPGAGNITIWGYAVDNRTGMPAPSASVYINITYPNNTMQNYTNTTNTQGYYNYTIATPWLGGTYLVNITAIDYQNVAGTANTTFRIRANLSVQTNKTQYNPNETAQITVYVSNNSAGISGATVNITVGNQSGTRTNFSTLWGNVTDKVNGNYTANYSGTQTLGNYTINATATKGSDDGAGNASFMVRRLNVTIQSLQTKVGESKYIYARVQDGTTNATVANATVNITITNATSVVNLTNTTSGSSGYNIVAKAYTDVAGRYNVTINVTDQNNITGTAILPYIVNLSVNLTLSQTAYDPNENITATITVRENITSMAGGATVVASLTDYNGTVISSNTTTTNATGTALVNFTAPGNFSSYYVNVTAAKNSINGTASRLFATSLLRIWTDKGEALIGSSNWASSGAPEKYRNITIKVAALDSAGLRRTGQTLTAQVYKPDGSLYGTYPLTESDKIYSTSVLLPGNNIPEGNYSIQIAEYPGIQGNFGVMMWGCVQCHKPNSISQHYVSHDGTSTTPTNFNINHTHQSLANGCDYHNYGLDSSCTACHANTVEGYPGSQAAPQKCTTCHYSPTTNQGNLNDTYGADLHANINTKTGGSWYGKSTACESCHGTLNATSKPTIPKCTNCHPASTNSGMQYMPEGLSGSNRTLEDFEDVADVLATTDRSGTTVAIATNTTRINGTYSGRVSYTFGSGYGRAYIDRKNLDLTNATKISLWVYGDNSNTNLSIGVNNTKSTKITWHMSAMTTINWSGWRKISVNIHELSQSSLMYISAADTVRIRLEKYGGCTNCAMLIDDLKAEKAGSHTEFDDIECGVCHGSKHSLALSPGCNACHQSVGHGWPAENQYPGTVANCINCHQTGMTENRINISNISQHTDLLEDFENISLFTTNLTNFNRSEIYYSGELGDNGNHSAVLNYTSLTGYRGNSINASNASKYKGISVFVNASNDPNTTLVLGVYTTTWYNYTRAMDWNGWKQMNVVYHNNTVNETTSFNATGTPARIWLGVYGNSSTGSIYFDSLRQALSDDYHQYVSWKCADCHIQTKNLPGITDITSPIVDCLLCHNSSEPHYKQFTRVCMDCHFDSGHGDVNPSLTKYEKASTCLKCHTQPHNFTQIHLEASHCNVCHDQRIHGKNSLNVAYNESLHLDCERCHGKTAAESPLPLTRGNAGSIFLRLSYTYNNATQCLFCHENKINAYKLHTNLTVNESNLTLVAGILNDTVCTDCHGTKSITNNTDRDQLTAGDTLREPHAPQIAGHGNVTCYECHGHRPQTLTLTVGSNCVGCHQDTSKLVNLIPGTLNDSSLSYVTNPGAQQLIVRPPQTTGHGNTSCAACHGHTNSNLTNIGSDDASCRICHQNTSSNVSLVELRLPNSTRSTVINPGGNPLYVIPPQVLGHGNTSCQVCHKHNPYTYKGATSLVGGTECELCHQNTSTNVTLVVNTTPASNKTVVIDNTTSTWIVRAPQVAGHGHTACSECHSHNAESLTYNGRTDADCVLCHYNASAKTYLLQNGSYVQPTQIVPHNDLNCTECHSHTPVSMTRISDCSVCHQNATKAQSLIDIYTIGLNITPPAGNISAMQIPNLSHSTGIKWNKTTAYWANDTYACQYCHKISRNYSSHNALGRVSAIQGNNVKNSVLVGSYWCASCHYQNYSSGNVTYNDTVRIYTEAGLPVPAEITRNTSYGNYTIANDGITAYYSHIMPDYSDAGCAWCHGNTTSNTKDFLHNVTESGGNANCISCHNIGGNLGEGKLINFTLANDSDAIHKTLNNGAATSLSAENKKCWACHGNGSEPNAHPSNYKTPYNCTSCHIPIAGQNLNYTPNTALLNITQHYWNGTNISTAAASSCYDCHNKSGMMLGAFDPDGAANVYGGANGGNNSTSHYGKKRNDMAAQQNTTSYCYNCHNGSSAFPFVSSANRTISNHSLTYPATNPVCKDCHNGGRIHNSTLNKPVFALPNSTYCLSCHGLSENASIKNFSQHNGTLNCTKCHLNSTRSIHPVTYLQINGSTWNTTRTNAVNCNDCHQQQLSGFSTAPIIPGTLKHSANISNGTIWGTFWTSASNSSCYYCHGNTKHNSNALGHINNLTADANNIKNSPLAVTKWCADCHYNDAINTNYLGIRWTPVPPLITVNNTGKSRWENHSTYLSGGYTDSSCLPCHALNGTYTSTSLNYSHSLNDGVAGGADCIACHDVGGSAGSGRLVNVTAINDSDAIHKTLNNGAATSLSAENKKCWACHGNGSEPGNSHTSNYKTPYRCVDCHISGTGQNTNFTPSSVLTVTQHYWNGTNISTAASSCYDCHNKSGMMLGAFDPDGAANVYGGANGGNNSTSHYGKKRSDMAGWNDTSIYCSYCHRNTTIVFPFGKNSSKNVDHGDDCQKCHGAGRIHDASLKLPTMSGDNKGCLNCHDSNPGTLAKNISVSGYENSAHSGVNCIDCHTPRQIFKGIVIRGETHRYNFSLPDNVTAINFTLEWGGDSILNATLFPPNETNISYSTSQASVPVNIPSPKPGEWTVIVRDISGDEQFTLTINVSMDHPGSTPNICENCHTGVGFGDAAPIYKHIPNQSNVPTNVSCVSCHSNGTLSARTISISASHYLKANPFDTQDCIRCHNGIIKGFGNPPDQRNYTRFATVNKTLISGEPWKLVDNYKLTLIEATREGAIFTLEKDGVLLRRELIAIGDVFKYEVRGISRENISIVNLKVNKLLAAKDQYVAELTGNVLASRIHRETDNKECYACHDSEYRTNKPKGMYYYVLKKDTENVTLAPIPVNFTELDTKMLKMGEDWNLGEGYSLRVVGVNLKRGNAQLQLYRNGTLIEDMIVNEGSNFTHEEWVLERKIDVFSSKLKLVFIGTKPVVDGYKLDESISNNGIAIVLSNVRLVAGEQKTLNATTQVLQEGTPLKYLWLDQRITIGEEPANFHVYTLTHGGYTPDCISCHSGNGVAPIRIDVNLFKKGVHAGLNRNANYTSFLSDEINKACWACHGNGSGKEPVVHPTPYLGNNTPLTCIGCHAYSQFGAKQISSHYAGAEISTSATCWDCHSNTVANKTKKLQATSHYSTRKDLLNTSNCDVCHNNETNASLWGKAPQVMKHNSSNNCTLCHAGNKVTTFHDRGITIIRNCEDCHVNKERADKFNIPAIRTHYPGAPEDSANTLKNNDYTCHRCHNTTNKTLHTSLVVREYQNETMGYCFQCHSTQGKFPNRPKNEIRELRHGRYGVGVKVISGCEECHAVEGVSKFHTPTLIGKGYFTGTAKYNIECTACHEKHEERKYQPYPDIKCTDCHSEYGTAHFGNAQIGLVNKSGACKLCHNKEADKFHNLTHIVANVTETAYEPCRLCHKDIEPLKGVYNKSVGIIQGGYMLNTSKNVSNESVITCTSCHNATGENRFHYDLYPLGTVQNPGWQNWSAGNITKCKDCHTYYGGEIPFNATNMGISGRSPSGTSHGLAPNCTLCHGGSDSISFHSLAATEFVPRIGVELHPETVSYGEPSLIQVTVVLPPLMKVTRAEYFIDEISREGYGFPLNFIIGGANDPSALLGALIDTTNLSIGKHLVFVHVKDSAGKWSKTEIVVLTVIKPVGLVAAEILLKEVVPILIFIGLLFIIWRRIR